MITKLTGQQNLCDEAGEVGVLPSLLPGESDISTFHLDCLNMQPEYSTEFSNEKQRLKVILIIPDITNS